MPTILSVDVYAYSTLWYIYIKATDASDETTLLKKITIEMIMLYYYKIII